MNNLPNEIILHILNYTYNCDKNIKKDGIMIIGILLCFGRQLDKLWNGQLTVIDN